MKSFFSRLNYSLGNEDWRVERKALQIQPDSNVVCITASGDRPLNLLLDACNQLTSVDANPVQNYLLSLKSAALEALDYDEYIRFLGAAPCDQRATAFRKVETRLDKESASFWQRRFGMIQKGVIYQGDVERLTRFISRVAGFFRPKKVKKLFQMDNLEEQQKFVREEWDTFLMRKSFDVALSRFLSKTVAFDPGLYTSVDPSIQLGSYVYNRMLASLGTGLAKENLLVSLIFRGFVGPEAFSPYLTPEGSKIIRDRIPKLVVKTENAIEHLENVPPNSYDRFSLSDIASYMDYAGFCRMMRAVYRAAKPGARFCIRQFSSNHPMPPELAQYFKRESALEKDLEQEDNCFVYRFMVGQIEKT